MEIAIAIVSSLVETLMVPIKKNLGYVISCTKNVRGMNTKIGDLNHTRNDVERHMKRNKSSNLEIPSSVPDWLKDPADINALVESFPSDVGSCSLKIRYNLGKKALEIIEDINSLIEQQSMMKWSDHGIPLGKVDSMKASTSTPSSHHDEFDSRKQTFLEALKALESDHKSHMVALCGMGGVGKTTMMEKLKKVATERKLFDFIVQATVGEKTNTFAIQQAVAEFIGLDLTEGDKATRAIKLCKCFAALSNEGKKFLIILLTSRDREVCIEMGVELNFILDVELLKINEATSFFFQFARISEDVDLDLDLDLRNIGDRIASRCHGLPIAIKTIAYTLKGKSKEVWEDALSSLNHHQLDERLHQIFEMSYNNLQEEETKSTLLLCGLFHKDFDTPKEDLVRYGWGLNLFSNVDTMQEARNRLSKHIERLIDANLSGCWGVKMHDLVRASILRMCSEGEHESIVGNMSKWPIEDTNESCKRISLTCTGMSEFPRDCKYPNLLLLKLIDGDESLWFHDDFLLSLILTTAAVKGLTLLVTTAGTGRLLLLMKSLKIVLVIPAIEKNCTSCHFYQEMGKLKVLAYEGMKCPMSLTSFRYSINLRTLCFDQCSSKIDFSPIGDMSNLEVLSITRCHHQRSPSTIGNLKKLKLLDFTGTIPYIEDGVLKSLVKLEELYMTYYIKHKCQCDGCLYKIRRSQYLGRVNGDELAICSRKLVALEIEFLDNTALPKGMSFEKLERFQITFGCSFIETIDEKNWSSSKNTLLLVANKGQLLDSGLNELFIKTEVLHLEVVDIRDGLVESFYPHQASFYNLRVLKIAKCVDLRYLFTVGVANGLTKLECLTVYSCPILETLLDSENNGVEATKFQALKFLSLGELPKLKSFCNNVNTIELPQLEELILESLPNFTSIYPDNKPTSSMTNDASTMQSFLSKEVVVTQLKKMKIREMLNLKEIWSSNDGEVRFSLLKEIEVVECHSLVNLFPSNPMSSLLSHLEELKLVECGSIDVLFDIDLGRVGGIEEVNSKLKSIKLCKLGNLREIWRVKGENASNRCIMRFEALENITTFDCESLNRVFPSATIYFDAAVLVNDEHWLATRKSRNVIGARKEFKDTLFVAEVWRFLPLWRFGDFSRNGDPSAFNGNRSLESMANGFKERKLCFLLAVMSCGVFAI
ncbi:hypothetical protein OSB04_028761, partial [Centaurea solstitialis]